MRTNLFSSKGIVPHLCCACRFKTVREKTKRIRVFVNKLVFNGYFLSNNGKLIELFRKTDKAVFFDKLVFKF